MKNNRDIEAAADLGERVAGLVGRAAESLREMTCEIPRSDKQTIRAGFALARLELARAVAEIDASAFMRDAPKRDAILDEALRKYREAKKLR